jgi:hypothetical protein
MDALSCRTEAVNAACCTDRVNCPREQVTPLTCTAECAAVYPLYLTECAGILQDALGTEQSDWAALEAFGASCATPAADPACPSVVVSDTGCPAGAAPVNQTSLSLAELAFVGALAYDPLLVAAPDGDIQGIRNADAGTREFYAIPYALPPVEELRWQPPVSNQPWEGVLDGTMPHSGCMSGYGGGGTEDCLYLNIAAPVPTQPCYPPGGYPVMVWYHGGCFTGGNPSNYDGSALIRQAGGDVIVVTVAFR